MSALPCAPYPYNLSVTSTDGYRAGYMDGSTASFESLEAGQPPAQVAAPRNDWDGALLSAVGSEVVCALANARMTPTGRPSRRLRSWLSAYNAGANDAARDVVSAHAGERANA